MALIEWRKEFETGIPGVDYEHAHLIELINGLVHTLGARPPKTLVSDVLGEINAKISAHFALEEKEMRERHYDQYADHKADHERLLDEIREIMDMEDQDPGFDYETEVVARLSRWFTEHFRTKDARFHRMMGGH